MPLRDDLTLRERAVLDLLRRGQSNRQIAERLVIAEKTVETHLTRVYGKLGVRGRAEAIADAFTRAPSASGAGLGGPEAGSAAIEQLSLVRGYTELLAADGRLPPRSRALAREALLAAQAATRALRGPR